MDLLGMSENRVYPPAEKKWWFSDKPKIIGQVEHGFAFIDDGYNFDITYGF